MTYDEFRTWIEDCRERAAELYEAKGVEQIRLTGEYAAFNEVAEKLKELEAAAVKEKSGATRTKSSRRKKTSK